MPNYVTHWLIADRAVAGLKGTAFEEPLKNHRECLLIGAVFYDALFYLPGRSKLASFKNIAYRLHGDNGEDTFQFPRELLKVFAQGQAREQLLAFTAGVACHIMSDAVFHPFVFYHTGRADSTDGASSRATQAHRRLESALDIHYAGGLKGIKAYSLREFLDRAGPWLDELYALAGSLLTEPGPDQQERALGLALAFRESMARFAKAQVFFRSRPTARLLYGCRRLLPDPLKEIAALGHHNGLKKYLPLLREPLNYRHPVTSVDVRTTMEQLFNRAVTQSIYLIVRLSDVIAGKADWPPDLVGPGLSSGLPLTPSSDLKEFSSRRLLGPRRRKHG